MPEFDHIPEEQDGPHDNPGGDLSASAEPATEGAEPAPEAANETREEFTEDAAAPPESASDEILPPDTKQWYIIHTYSGFERKVAESLRTRADAFGFGGQIGQILIPEEEVVELRNGKKVTSKRLLYPGYVVVQMAMRNADGS